MFYVYQYNHLLLSLLADHSKNQANESIICSNSIQSFYLETFLRSSWPPSPPPLGTSSSIPPPSFSPSPPPVCLHQVRVGGGLPSSMLQPSFRLSSALKQLNFYSVSSTKITIKIGIDLKVL